MLKDSYEFIQVIAKKGHVTLEKYKNILAPYDTIYCVKKNERFINASHWLFTAFEHFKQETRNNA